MENKALDFNFVALLILVLFFIFVMFWIVRYFFNYALKRSSTSSNRRVEEKEGVTENQRKAIYENKQKIYSEQEKWLRNTPMKRQVIKSQDGLLLTGEYAMLPAAHRWAILVHGYKGNRHDMESYGMEYYRRGYNILMPDNRACGESQGKYLGMGWLDRKDILLWIQWILEKDADSEIVLHGVSMGAATVMMVAGEELPEQVKAFVEDCGYTSVYDVLASEMRVRFKLPAFPLVSLASLYSIIAAGYSFKEASALKQVMKNNRPKLFIHGSAFLACPCPAPSTI